MIKLRKIEKIINSDIEKTFEIFSDHTKIQKFLPEFFSFVKIHSSRNNVTVVEEHLKLGTKQLTMMIKHTLEPIHLHEILIIGGDCKGSRILQKFERTDDGTRIKIEGQLKINGMFGLKGLFFNKKIHEDYSKMINALSKIAES